jgi:putative ABC transport system permease protein
MEYAVQKDIKALGSNTVYIDKWEYADGGNDYPWWKYVNALPQKRRDAFAERESKRGCKCCNEYKHGGHR